MPRPKGSKNKPKQEWSVVEETPLAEYTGFDAVEPTTTVEGIRDAMAKVKSATDPFWDELPPVGAFLLFQAMAFKQGLGALRFYNIFRTIVDEKGGVWSCGESDEGIRITYEENHFAQQQASNTISKVRSELGTALRALKDAKENNNQTNVKHWEERVEAMEAQIEELTPISNSKITHIRVFPFYGKAKVI